jgi:hypothetical protein
MTTGPEFECTIVGAIGTVTFRSRVEGISTSTDPVVALSAPDPLELTDRRQYARKSLGGEVTWAALAPSGQVGDPHSGHMVNISAGGMLFRTVDLPEEPGVALALALAMSFVLGGEPITCVISAIRIDRLNEPVGGMSHVVHAQMLAIDSHQRERIEDFVSADEGLYLPFRSRTT